MPPAYYREYYEKNKERILARHKKWRDTHVYKGVLAINYRRMVISLLLQRDGDKCGICHGPIEKGDESIDHIIQRAKGGPDTCENIRLTHDACNKGREKWSRTQGRLCTIEGCARKHMARGLCNLHYKRKERGVSI